MQLGTAFKKTLPLKVSNLPICWKKAFSGIVALEWIVKEYVQYSTLWLFLPQMIQFKLRSIAFFNEILFKGDQLCKFYFLIILDVHIGLYCVSSPFFSSLNLPVLVLLLFSFLFHFFMTFTMFLMKKDRMAIFLLWASALPSTHLYF